jgi:predicted lipid-binding transport protein (Tim44 family)
MKAMSEGFAYIDILFFAMVAAFIALRLRSVLGRRTGNEQRRETRLDQPEPHKASRDHKDNVVHLPDRQPQSDGEIGAGADGDVKAGLTQIRLADRRFDPNGFVQGARAAFEMIVDAFAKGDKATLRPLLADSVFANFTRAIDDRQRAGHELETNLVAIQAVDIVEAGMSGPHARLTLRFRSEQVNVTRDLEGAVVEGDPGTMAEIVDLWTFERDTRTSDPNWRLVETRTPD